MWKRKTYEGLCPFNCKKYRVASEAARVLLAREAVLQTFCDRLCSACNTSENGFQILGIERKGDSDYIVVVDTENMPPGGNIRNIFLYTLPFQHRQDWLCRAKLVYYEDLVAYISFIGTRFQNNGYGTILMKHLISFLRSAGYRRLTGCISWTDFNHEDLLRHFYGKFGFKITDQEHQRLLELELSVPWGERKTESSEAAATLTEPGKTDIL